MTEQGPGTKRTPNWTEGAPKWTAVAVLALASIGSMAWSIFGRRPNPNLTPVPIREPSGPGQAATAPGTPAADAGGQEQGALRRINVNTATAPELHLLPGIGPAFAARIIEDRESNGPFESLDDLQRIKGIGPRTVERLLPYATTGND